MPTLALIPVRSFENGKSRLAGVLDRESRAGLVRSMLAQVMRSTLDSGVVERVLVVSPDPDVLDFARAFDRRIEPIEQPSNQPGLNTAVTFGRDRAIALGADRLLIMFADLPALTPDDVRLLASNPTAVVIATDWHRTGTNGMLLRFDEEGARQFTFQYGPESGHLHAAEADRLGLRVATVVIDGLAIDLDTPEDFDALAASGRNLPDWLPAALDRRQEMSA